MKQKKRIEAIQEMAKKYGYPISKGCYLISFWELAAMLNNTWKAYLFVSKKYSKDYGPNMVEHFAINDYDYWRFRRMINWTVKRTAEIKKATKGYPEWYQIKTNP